MAAVQAAIERFEGTEALISLWREERCLWDIRSPLYRNKIARNRSFQILMEKMALSGKQRKRIYIHSSIKSTRTRRLKWPPKRPELKLGPDLQSNL